jgi:tetratricopeptide (TPR) repeat protein
MGVLSFLKKEYDDALIYFLDAVKVKKDFADAWFNLADTYSVIGDDSGEKAARKKFEKLNER